MTYTVRTIGSRIVKHESQTIESALGFAYGWNNTGRSTEYVEVVNDHLTVNEEPATLHATEGR